MDVYLVGGAVRDELLGIPFTERDWVVVGSNPKQMESQGYKQVGKDFPVFLHPESKEEYALARTERKKGRGYHGFEVHASPNVTLEDDLQRRDLTINAIAKSKDNKIIDPYGGQQDLKNKVLRHVSDAFSEDPLRVIRVARFAAKLHHLGFTIADETLQLMRHIVSTREIHDLSDERIWQETHKALSLPSPEQFFLVLHDVHALSQTHPSINDEFSHPPSRELALASLNKVVASEPNVCIRLATLLTGLFLQKPEEGHKNIQALCDKLIIPKACKDLLLLSVLHQNSFYEAFELDKYQLLNFLRHLDAKRKPDRFSQLLIIFKAVYLSNSSTEYCLQTAFLQTNGSIPIRLTTFINQ